MRTMCRSRWFLPLFALGMGGVIFGAQAIGGHPGSGLVSLGIMAFAGAVFLFGGRSETIRGLRGDGRDERFQRIDLHATAFAGTGSLKCSRSWIWQPSIKIAMCCRSLP